MAFFWWRLERFAEVCQDLPDPPWLTDRKSAATRRDAGPDRGRTRSGPFLRPHSAVLDRLDEFQNVLNRRVGQDAVAEIGEPVEELKRRELDDAVGAGSGGLFGPGRVRLSWRPRR